MHGNTTQSRRWERGKKTSYFVAAGLACCFLPKDEEKHLTFHPCNADKRRGSRGEGADEVMWHNSNDASDTELLYRPSEMQAVWFAYVTHNELLSQAYLCCYSNEEAALHRFCQASHFSIMSNLSSNDTAFLNGATSRCLDFSKLIKPWKVRLGNPFYKNSLCENGIDNKRSEK